MVTTVARPPSPGTKRPLKRARFASIEPEHASQKRRVVRASSPGPLHRQHPLLVKPSGNALLNPDKARQARAAGLGTLSILSDEVLLDLFYYMSPQTVFRLQGVSRAFFAFTRHQALWKVFHLSQSNGRLDRWDGDWRRTFWASFCAPANIVQELYSENDDVSGELDLVMPADGITSPDICSDVLYQPHFCSTPLDDLFRRTGALHNLQRVDASSISAQKFARDYAEQSIPVILASLVNQWPCMKHQTKTSWELGALVERFKDVSFRAEAASVPIHVYARYCASIERDSGLVDESPLYLFDAEFVRRTAGVMGGEFEVPPIFGEDLFRVMGEQRPDYRWLIAGPSRAGSTWHKDPNSTSAWNAVVKGSKGWILFPPDCPPPGVFVSDDESEVTAPLSLAEWFSNYYTHALSMYGPRSQDPKTRGKMIQGICHEGEVMYIPSGWWHIVVNLESCVAVTQNFVSETELPAVLHFMRDRPEQVSGFKLDATQDEADDDDADAKAYVYTRFCVALEREEPDLFARTLQRMEQRFSKQAKAKKSGLWESISTDNGQSTFSFGFGDDLELELEP